MNKVSNNLKNKQLTGLVFLDRKKTFDPISHNILIKIRALWDTWNS